MYAFIDESGLPHPSDSTRRPVLLAACIGERNLRPVVGEIRRIKVETVGNPDWELKASETVIPKTIAKRRYAIKSCVDQVVAAVERFDIAVFAVIMEHPDVIPFDDPARLPIQFAFLLDRVDRWAAKKRANALVVFDDRPDESVLARRFYALTYPCGRSSVLSRVVEMPLFVDSKSTPGIQIADLLAGIVRKHYEAASGVSRGSAEFRAWVERLFVRVSRKTKDFGGGRGGSLKGLFEMPLDCFKGRRSFSAFGGI